MHVRISLRKCVCILLRKCVIVLSAYQPATVAAKRGLLCVIISCIKQKTVQSVQN